MARFTTGQAYIVTKLSKKCQDGSFLFAVNAGMGTISTFRVQPFGLAFVGEADSGGAEPISIAIHGDIL
ncbi:MAG: hypothetical protein JOZ60_00950 [Verrucomicrobia bacterium]|nr:hypothetical protein [Verrucomicrobiota bacterium]